MTIHVNAMLRIVQKYRQEAMTPAMVWPSRCPNLNLIEHIWDLIGRRPRQLPTQSTEQIRSTFFKLAEIRDQIERQLLVSHIPLEEASLAFT